MPARTRSAACADGGFELQGRVHVRRSLGTTLRSCAGAASTIAIVGDIAGARMAPWLITAERGSMNAPSARTTEDNMPQKLVRIQLRESGLRDLWFRLWGKKLRSQRRGPPRSRFCWAHDTHGHVVLPPPQTHVHAQFLHSLIYDSPRHRPRSSASSRTRALSGLWRPFILRFRRASRARPTRRRRNHHRRLLRLPSPARSPSAARDSLPPRSCSPSVAAGLRLAISAARKLLSATTSRRHSATGCAGKPA